jgi:hypothetical protein
MVATHANRAEVVATRDRRTIGVPSAPATAASFARVVLDDLLGRRPPRADFETHLLAAEAWLCRAQDASGNGGVSYGYSLRGGWRPSYPETSGYIATTFLRLGRSRHPSYRQRALRILDWLLGVQNADGSFANPRYGAEGIVFDTGQVLFGLVRGYEETGEPRLLGAARRAARWLTRIADNDRCWTRHEHLGTPHVHNPRRGWALLLMNTLEFDAARAAVARRNLDWALAEQRDSGFFEHCAFRGRLPPFTHTIAYTARGLLESAMLLDQPRYRAAAVRCADAVLAHLREDGHLPSTITVAGRAAATSCCLTGNCQFAIVWLRLAGAAARPHYRQAAQRALDHVMATQDLATASLDRRGGIKGSQPAWGRYAPLSYPNWAAKFFVDAMWLLKDAPP